MRAEILPSVAKGNIKAPPSKSVAHRALICAALSECSLVSGISYSKDIKATLNCLETMGAYVEQVSFDTVRIGGLKTENIKECELDCFESGSTLRFLIPIALLSGKKIVFTGSDRLFERPLTVYEKVCAEQGLKFNKNGNVLTVNGKLNGGEFFIDGSISSQFVSGFLFALPLVESDSKIVLSEDSESLSYIEMTLKTMELFGIKIERPNNFTFIVKGKQKYMSKDITVEGDYSNSAFLDAFNLLGGKVNIESLNALSAQGDKIYKKLFNDIDKSQPVISLKDCPDLGPILFTLAAAKNGAVFINTKRLKIKESDRVEAMKAELSKFGAKLICEDNKVIVKGGGLYTPTDVLCAHNDHRVVMSLAVLASVYGGIIDGAEAVRKSFPDFFNVIESLGVKVKYYDA